MTNIILKWMGCSPHFMGITRQKGSVKLIITLVLLVTILLLILFSGELSVLAQKVMGNQYRNSMAFQAAEAGLEYALPYFQQNSTRVLGNQSNGFILPYTASQITNVTLANNAQYTVLYTNPVINNFNLIQMTVTGISDDGSATRVLTEEIQVIPAPPSFPRRAITNQGNMNLDGNVTITNASNNRTINSGGNVILSGAAKTVLNSGVSSTAGNIKSDITEHNSNIGDLSAEQLFLKYFKVDTATVQNNVDHYFNNSSDTEYNSSLDGLTGASIWIDQPSGTTASISGTTTIGSPTSPVIIVINSDTQITGNVTIYGMLYIMGTANVSGIGTFTLHGGIITTGDLDVAENANITFDLDILAALPPVAAGYTKVLGSWRDF